MIIDALSKNNEVTFNSRLAKLWGLNKAIYISELLNQYSRTTKSIFEESNEFIVNREEIFNKTTISIASQKEMDKLFLQNNILLSVTSSTNIVSLNLEKILYTITGVEDSYIVKTATTKKVEPPKEPVVKQTKKDVEKEILKSNITTSNKELRSAYEDWIDSVYSKLGWMSRRAVIMGQQIIDDFSKHNLDVALDVIRIAEASGWKDMIYAVNRYKELHPVENTVKSEKIENTEDVSEEVF